MFDDTDDFFSFELKSILNHRYLAGVLEFKLEYDHGELSWHPLDLVKDKDPHACARYIAGTDLGPISNGIHRRWYRALLISLKKQLCAV